jgi:uncharacterized protein
VIVVADTSVLLNLCAVGESELLRGLFREILIPPEVSAEFERLAADTSRFRGLLLPEWIRVQNARSIPQRLRSITGLDPGELAALSLALEILADAILIDERKGQHAAANFGIKTIGVLGILLQAKGNGLIPAVAPLIDRLHREAGFWISDDLLSRVLKLARE